MDQQDPRCTPDEWTWLEGLEVAWRARYLVVAAALLAGVVVAAIMFLVPRTYGAEATIRVGKVMDRLIADPLNVALEIGDSSMGSRLSRAGFTDRTPETLARAVSAAVPVQGTGATTTPSPFVTVVAEGDSGDAAKRLALAVAQLIVDDHQRRFDASMERLRVFRSQIDRQIAEVRAEVAEIDAALKTFRSKPTVDAPAILLMRAQLEEKQTQLLDFLREERDLDLNLTIHSERTVVVADPLLPKERLRPRRTITTLAASASGGLLAVFWALVLDGRRRRQQTPRGAGTR